MVKALDEEFVPERGDLVWLSLDPQAGHEQAGRRPVLILSPAAYNAKSGLAIVCPVTSRGKGYPFEVAIPSGLDVAGVILSDHVKSLDWRARNVRFICSLAEETVLKVVGLIGSLIDDDGS